MSEANLPTEEDLRQLPRAAIVAYAARAARRVQPLYRPKLGLTDEEQHRLMQGIEDSIVIAEAYARTGKRKYSIANAAANAINAALDDLAVAVAGAADAAEAVADNFSASEVAIQAAFEAASRARISVYAKFPHGNFAKSIVSLARNDYTKLKQLCSNVKQPLEFRIDPSEQGPLGPLWPQGAPEWFLKPELFQSSVEHQLEIKQEIKVEKTLHTEVEPLYFYFDDDDFSPEETAEILKLFSDLAEAHGGEGLEIQKLQPIQCGNAVPEEV